ncbi:MAG: N-acetyltransferase [Bacteroidetes bacterium]|nr:N-acetyltransferase [Bacteroidota bacterium]
MIEDLQVVNNKKGFRFEIAFSNGEYAFVEYRWLKGNMVLMRTLVPADMRGKGIGAHLVKHVLDYVRSNNLKIVVYCAFVAKYLENHPEYNELVAK